MERAGAHESPRYIDSASESSRSFPHPPSNLLKSAPNNNRNQANVNLNNEVNRELVAWLGLADVWIDLICLFVRSLLIEGLIDFLAAKKWASDESKCVQVPFLDDFD